MRTMLQNHKSLSLLGLAAIVGFSITSCSSSQPYIDTDGIYNSEKYKPVETHENNEYYTKYFEEKKTEADHFTDIDNYTSYSTGAPAWGDSSSETIIYNYGGGYYNDWMSPWGFGWNSPYYSWGWGSSFWGWGYPYYGWGSGYYGWYSPYYYGYGYGYGYPFYGTGRNVSYASNHRTVGDRFISPAGRNTNTRTASRQMNNTTLANSRNISTARIQNNTRTSSNVPTREYNTRTQNNNNRNQTINRNEINRSSTPTMRTTTPSTGRSMSTGGMGGGGRSMSTGGGRR